MSDEADEATGCGCAFAAGVLFCLLALWLFHGCGKDEERMKSMQYELRQVQKDVEEIKKHTVPAEQPERK